MKPFCHAHCTFGSDMIIVVAGSHDEICQDLSTIYAWTQRGALVQGGAAAAPILGSALSPSAENPAAPPSTDAQSATAVQERTMKECDTVDDVKAEIHTNNQNHEAQSATAVQECTTKECDTVDDVKAEIHVEDKHVVKAPRTLKAWPSDSTRAPFDEERLDDDVLTELGTEQFYIGDDDAGGDQQCESDLAQEAADEADSVVGYEMPTQENTATSTLKSQDVKDNKKNTALSTLNSQDVKYNTQGLVGPGKNTANDWADSESTQTELEAANVDYAQDKMMQDNNATGTQAVGLGKSVFARNLAQEVTEEADSLAGYDMPNQENEVTSILKSQDVKCKSRKFVGLDKSSMNDIDVLEDLDEKAGEQLSALRKAELAGKGAQIQAKTKIQEKGGVDPYAVLRILEGGGDINAEMARYHAQLVQGKSSHMRQKR